jgi:hypothetical protein
MAATLSVIAGGAESASSSVETRQLFAWSSPFRPPIVGVSLQAHGAPARLLGPGVYRFQVKAVDDMAFRLVGPDISRSTKLQAHRDSWWQPGPHYTLYETWVVRLKKGRYVYAAVGPGADLSRLGGLRTTGSFVVR